MECYKCGSKMIQDKDDPIAYECPKCSVNYPFGPIPNWVKCEERLPENDDLVLIWDGSYMAFGMYLDKVWVDKKWIKKNVIAWMPIPKPPEKHE